MAEIMVGQASDIADGDYRIFALGELEVGVFHLGERFVAYIRLQVALLGNPFAVQQHLQGAAQGGEAETLMFHFNDDRIVVGISNVGQVIQTTVRHRAGAENRLAMLEEVDDLVVANLLSHALSPPVSGLATSRYNI